MTPTELLPIALSAAVPLKIADLAGYSPDARALLARDSADTIAAHGDDLQYGGKDCAPTFAALVRGLAVGAYQPGGITFAGTCWCAAHHPFGATAEWPCADCTDPVTAEPAGQPVTTIQVAGGRL